MAIRSIRETTVNVNDQLQQARQLINDGMLGDARRLLSELDHPTAHKWLAKLDETPLDTSNTMRFSGPFSMPDLTLDIDPVPSSSRTGKTGRLSDTASRRPDRIVTGTLTDTATQPVLRVNDERPTTAPSRPATMPKRATRPQAAVKTGVPSLMVGGAIALTIASLWLMLTLVTLSGGGASLLGTLLTGDGSDAALASGGLLLGLTRFFVAFGLLWLPITWLTDGVRSGKIHLPKRAKPADDEE